MEQYDDSLEIRLNTEKPPRDPAIRVVLLPKDTNRHGTIFGGIILSYIDLAGAVEVTKHTRQRIVTVSVEKVVFKEPVMVGEVVSFYTSTTRIGNSSISVHVDVEAMRGGVEEAHVTSADLTYVCVDDNGRPTPVLRIS
ncbi:MAG TPA: acyl-CoA thioesterase [Planktothrix sp.]|jgi:acyl-CoA thioesterase YciA